MSSDAFDLGALVREVVADVDTLTATFQVPVEHWAWVGLIGDGDDRPRFVDAPIVRNAIVEAAPSSTSAIGGEVTAYSHHIVFLTLIEPNGSEGRREPIDPRDMLVLPDGTTAPIARISGPMDASTLGRYVTEVWLGAAVGAK